MLSCKTVIFLSNSQTNATNYYPGTERGREPESAEVLSENNPKVCALQIGLLHLMQKQLLLN